MFLQQQKGDIHLEPIPRKSEFGMLVRNAEGQNERIKIRQINSHNFLIKTRWWRKIG